MQRGHDVDIPAAAPMNLLTSATTVVRSSAGLSGEDFAVCFRLLRSLRGSSADDPEAGSAPATPPPRPGAADAADLFRSAEAVLVPCRTSLGVRCQQLSHPGLVGPTGKVQRECQAHNCRRLCADAVRQATRAPALLPPYQELMLGPLLADQPVQRSTMLRPAWAAERQPCALRYATAVRTAPRWCPLPAVSSQQFKINRADAAAGAMAEHEDRTTAVQQDRRTACRALAGYPRV